ncbi:Elongation factor 1-alpha [Phytophthora cinnamomi]|uniref:Elongation factor 1-alpha n=1 Tax=Phytophthora cinnamomi TaxID=4785 RepID=UPI00355A0868|nr:Elongation factor 1-alpha [Phytophthora cinnamomi]
MSVCGPDGSSLYSVSGCTADEDYSAYTVNAFGNYTPYLIMEEWDSSDCKGDRNVTVYTADGSCHSNTDDKTSFKVTLNTDSTAVVTTASRATVAAATMAALWHSRLVG